MGDIIIKKEAINTAKKGLEASKHKLADFPEYDLKSIFAKSQGNSTDEIKKMFENLDALKVTVVDAFTKTVDALTKIDNDFESFDHVFEKAFKGDKK